MVTCHPDFIRAKPCKNFTRQYYAERKLDGHRIMLKKDKAFFKGTGRNAWNTLPDSVRDLAPDVYVDGELIIPGKSAADIRRVDFKNLLQFQGFYIPSLQALPDIHRKEIGLLGLPQIEIISQAYQGYTPEELERIAKSQKWEGMILKAYSVFPEWYKFKLEKVIDCIVLGIKPGTGKYIGQCGALFCGAFVKGEISEICAVSGMDDAQRKLISPSDVGRIAEIRFQEVAQKGRLRHPRFIRWRDDKNTPDDISDFLP